MFETSSLYFIVPVSFYLLKPVASHSSKIILAVATGTLYFIISLWESYVTEIIPEPYLDEIFHIPQAQAYCHGRFRIWNHKIATPPGLYILASFKEFAFQILTKNFCDVYALRSFNCMTLIITFIYLFNCRLRITKSYRDAIHSAFNIALFPPLFFSSALFYTDTLSICLVLVVYQLALDKRGFRGNSLSSLWLFIVGLLSVTVRQTNIFWVTVFAGGLELLNTLVSEEPKKLEPDTKFNGRIHDILIYEAGLQDYFIFCFSLVVAAICRAKLLLREFRPYIALILTFGAFIFWNGGVVLGDKTNHVATIHLPQMLYIWPLITFFSAPLMIPAGIRILKNTSDLTFNKHISVRQSSNVNAKIKKYSIGAIMIISLIIKYNTVIHPFTLADNRHYMFYVFRYTILYHPSIRFLLAPIYIFCSCLVYLTLSTPLLQSQLEVTKPDPAIQAGRKIVNKPDIAIKTNVKPVLKSTDEYRGPQISLALILLTTTTLSLVTCPLVEPRYFITPWVLWRLNMPLFYSEESKLSYRESSTTNVSNTDNLNKEKGFCSRMSSYYLIWIETFWFLLINLGTGYLFLYRDFEWSQEPGKLQRFMW